MSGGDLFPLDEVCPAQGEEPCVGGQQHSGGARSLSVVEDQSAGISAEWLLVLGGLVRGRPWSSGDLDISRALMNVGVGRGERCQSDGGSGCSDGQWRDVTQFHDSSFLCDLYRRRRLPVGPPDSTVLGAGIAVVGASHQTDEIGTRTGAFAPEDWADPQAFYKALERGGTPSAEMVESAKCCDRDSKGSCGV